MLEFLFFIELLNNYIIRGNALIYLTIESILFYLDLSRL
jgi:hypothetical protein